MINDSMKSNKLIGMIQPKKIIDDHKAVNINHATLEQILQGDFFRKLQSGIYGESIDDRLQTCWMTCGVR